MNVKCLINNTRIKLYTYVSDPHIYELCARVNLRLLIDLVVDIEVISRSMNI